MPEKTNDNEGSSTDDNVNNVTIPTNCAEQINESLSSQGPWQGKEAGTIVNKGWKLLW